MMKRKRFVALVAVTFGCGGGDPDVGTEGGHCYSNGTCDGALVCLSDLCVDPGTSTDAALMDGAASSDGPAATDAGAGSDSPIVGFPLSVFRDGTGDGTVTSSPSGIDCGTSCSVVYGVGTVVTLTATPDANSVLQGWAGACTGSGACTFTMDGSKTVTATFTRPELTVLKAGVGDGTVTSVPAGINCGESCSSIYVPGTNVTLTAMEETNSTFDNWSGGGCSGTGLCEVTLAASTTVTATFTFVGDCNPIAQTGCAASEKCTWVVDSAGPPEIAHTGCAPNGDKGAGLACTTPAEGYDDCVAGYHCLNSVCTEICTTAPNSCGDDYSCVHYSDIWDDLANIGLCNWNCDPVQQNCPLDIEACYLQANNGKTVCGGIPNGAEGVVQDMACYGPTSGGCYLNGCDKGYGANQPDDTCAFFCNPIDNWKDNINGLSGDPGGITCAATFADRPNGPGPTYECRYIESFWTSSDGVAATTGLCVDPAKTPTVEWGSYGTCADFEWVQLQSDINDNTANQTGYCDTICPECCMVNCISRATFDAAFAAKSSKPTYACFSANKAIRDNCALK